jgi:hypothetical protein
MPAYTPVTRGPAAPEQHLPEPGNDYGSYGRQGGAQPTNPPQESAYPNDPAQSYQQPYPSQNYQPQNYPPQSYPAEPRPAPSYQPQTYSTPAEPVQPRPAPSPSLRDTVFSGAAPARARADSFGDFPDRIFPEQISSEPSHADASYGDAGYAEPGYDAPIADASYQDASYPDGNAAETADASYTDASFSEASYGDASYADPNVAGGYADPRYTHQPQAPAGYPAAPHAQSYGEHEPLDPGGHDGYDANLEPDLLAEPARHDYGGQPQHQGQGGSRALQAFDAPYDQGAPQIQLGATQYPPRADALYDTDQADADFLDEGQLAPGAIGTTAQPVKAGLRGRSIFMVGSALLGAIALGGALAFAYKQSGGAMNGGEPPVVQADARPVKEVPQDAGGKDFPNKNKMIYERLQGGDQPEAEHIVPRQEELAMPAMPGVNPTAGLPADAAPVAPPAVATVDDPEGGPRRVKTLVVKADGSVMEPPPEAAAAPQAPAAPQQVASADGAAPPAAIQPIATVSAIPPMPGAAAQAAPAPAPVAAAPVAQPPAAAPAPVAADPQPVAAIPPAKPAPKVVAAAAPEPAAKPSKYVIQVGSKQNQTEALATFADIQQKYPTLVANYRPMVQKADLGAKGVWYRLRIGPIPDKAAASKLCTQLKSQGMPDCLVMAAQ